MAIKDDLGSKDWFQSSYSDIYDRYGSIRWNYAYFSVNDEHRYLVSLPFVDSDHTILGIMFVQGHDDHYDYSFRSRNQLFEVAIDESYEYEDAITNIALLTLNSLEISRNHVVIEQYNSFARSYSEHALTISTPRAYTISWTTMGESTYGDWAALVIHQHKEILPCGGGGGGVGAVDLFFTDGDDEDIASGSTTNNNNDEDRETIIAEIDNLLANLEECDKITISTEAKELIANQANILDPCQPDKTAQELIEELISELCINKEGINIEGNEITDFNNIDVTDGIIEEEDVEEVLSNLDKIEKQINDYINSIANTNDCTEKYIEDLYNILEESDCDLSTFSNAYRDYFGITETTDEQTVPTIGVNDILCENMFTVTSVEDELHVSAGISGFNFQVKNKNDVLVSISHPYLQIMMAENIGACAMDYTHESIMAEAMNAAISKIGNLMKDYESYEELNNATDFGDSSIIDDAFQKTLTKEIWDIYYSCGASPSSGPQMSNSTDWGDKCHTIYNQLSENNINDCN
jgi:hypothetical protein